MVFFTQVEDRYFQERGYIEFLFDVGEVASTEVLNRKNKTKKSFKVRIPFYENPSINESKQARLAKYKPIGRNSNLYSFLGADSTMITLNFNLTLPHLYHNLGSASDIGRFVKIYKDSSINDFDPNPYKGKPDLFTGILQTLEEYQAQYYNFQGLSPVNPESIKVKALYYFWTNIIRCSVIGTSDHRSPPPTVRLNFGPLHKNKRFVVEKYQITNDDKAGYDVETMLPRQIKVSLTMEELRVGNFGKYSPYGADVGSSTLDGENVAGWEYIMETGSLDPMISPIQPQEPEF